ncbi:DUF5105 domain-containing protein [Clostridium sp. SM-530-WT-3G]|uniref:DUF5105 domain-containing protein n=1 Tax=Clostridium sp. SM-530-WT-3G TaxID=2725303 RepID=UPI00145CD7A9|nr:DUF5105 domain-containing protein [Clostridium sp. SM-530-WT-3G]NME81548.1 DUF5105 domain-containing protein [Clostridium sp. SM-530-WT-3G]
MKYVRRFISVIMSMLCIYFMIGCGSQPAKAPSVVVSEEIDNIKNGNRDLYKNMFWHGMININSDRSVKDIFQNSSRKIDKALGDITYTINSENISGDEAIVNVTVTGPELDNVWGQLVKCVKNDLSSGVIDIMNLNIETIGERYDNIISNLLDNNMKTSTRTMDIKLKKEDGQWKISNTDNIIKLTINIHPDNVKHVLNNI